MLYSKANEIKRKYKINNKRDVQYLIDVIHKLGHNVCTFSDERMKLAVLNLKEKNKTAHAITVMDHNGNITVYYNDKLPKSVQRFALAHEIGHIVLGHLNVYRGNVEQERDADKFARYILSPDNRLNIPLALLSIFLSIAILILTATFILSESNAVLTNKAYITNSAPDNSIKNDTVCYFTKYGTVYHLDRNCYYLKYSDTVYTSTVDQCGLNRLCSACKKRHN